jgi:phosphohistidine phosphatase
MDLLIVRHAIAFERNRQMWSDDGGRPLSPLGIRRARKAAAGLKRLVPAPELVWTSPLLRAKQTAQVLTELADWPEAIECPELSPGEPPQSLLRRLSGCRRSRVAVVGHQPSLGNLLTACLLEETSPLAIEMKKNAVACVSFKGVPRAGRGILEWLASPRMLRSVR